MVQWLLQRSTGARIVGRSVHTTTLLQMITCGAAVGVLPIHLGEGLVALEATTLPSFPLWMSFHQDDRQRPAVRAVIDWVVETVG